MSANEDIELESLQASSNHLQKIAKNDPHAETINEIKEEADVETPLLQQTSDPSRIPISPSDLSRMEIIETTFTIDNENDDKEAVSLIGDPENLQPEDSRSQLAEILLRIKELAQDYIEFVIGGVVLFLLMIIILVILPQCFHSLYFDEYALSRSSLTGRVDDTYVYEPGWHFVSPWNEWIKFYKTAHAVRLNDLNVYTTDQLLVKASFSIYYFLEKDSIGKLYRKLGDKYVSVIYKVCLSEMINLAQAFSIEDFRTKRASIKRTIKSRLTDRLKTDYGIRLFDIYLDSVKFDKVINDLNLKRVINDILNEKEEFVKEIELTYAETQVLVTDLNNKAAVLTENANNNATLGVMRAEKANYDRIIESAHIIGLKENFDGLNIVDNKHKMSFCWVNSLVYNEKIKYHQNNRVNETNISGFSAFSAAMSMML